MYKRIFIVFLLFSGICWAQKSIQGKILISGAQDREFIIRNTKVVLTTEAGTDTTSVRGDLTFGFENLSGKTATIYLRSPMLSPKAQTKFRLRKNKPTKIRLDYGDIFEFSVEQAPVRRERDVPIAEAANLFQMIFLLVSTFHR